MSARAQKLVPQPSHIIDRAGEPVATARLMSIGDAVIGLDRFVALGAPALIQAAYPWVSARARRDAAPLPVVVALPSESRPGFDSRLTRQLLPALEARTRLPLDHERSALVFGCRGGGVIAFEHALAALRHGGCEVVAVGGIDSYFDPDVLEWLDRELRLHGPATENGFIPGEGAAFLLLAARGRTHGLHRYGQVISAASAREPRPYGSPEPCLGLGATLAMRGAAEAIGATARRIPWALTDVANERHRVDEWAYASARTSAAFTPDLIHDQPLLQTGDLGAASAAALLSIAAIGWDTGAALGDCALVVTHSDGPERGAMTASREGLT